MFGLPPKNHGNGAGAGTTVNLSGGKTDLRIDHRGEP
jgi:hypothetical protein